MKQFFAAVFLLGIVAAPAVGHFHRHRSHSWFGRPAAAYYAPATPYYVEPAVAVFPAAPFCLPPVALAPPVVVAPPIAIQPQPAVIVQPPPIVIQPHPPVHVQPPPPVAAPSRPPIRPPQQRPIDSAAPETAPPSERGPVIPPARPMTPTMPTRTTSLKPGEVYFSTYSCGEKSNGRGVTFWNLSQNSLTLRAGGQTQILAAGRSTTMELDREFTWQVADRPEQTARLAAEEDTMTVVIRR